MEKETQKYREWLEAIAANKNLRGEDFRVLLLLMANASNDRIEITQTEMASKLRVSKSCISRAINRLFTSGIIAKRQCQKDLIIYRFSAEEVGHNNLSHSVNKP